MATYDEEKDYGAISDEESARLNKDDRTYKFDGADTGTDLYDLAERSMPIIRKMVETGVTSRQPRFDQIRKNEDMYNGLTPPALRGRSNIPFDCLVMRGFIDTLLSGIDEPVDITYGAKQERGTKAAKKKTALFKAETGPDKCNIDDQMQNSKFLAALSGRGFGKIYSENYPKFCFDFSVPDHYDMVVEAQGGFYLDKHLFKFEQNVFLTKSELREGARNGLYNAKKVAQLMGRYADPEFKKTDDQFKNKMARYASFGIDIEAEAYVGQNLYRMTEGAVSINHEWYYVLFSFEAETWVRFEKLSKVFPWASDFPGRGAWLSWATHRHPFMFWTAAPADDIRAIGYTMKKILNLTVDELEKNIWDMKAYDPRMFTEPTKLMYKQDALVRATLKPGQKMSDGIFRFQTGDHSGISINLMEYLDSTLGRKTGITADAEGDSNEKVLGIQVNNVAATSKRMRLTNRQFAKMYEDIGIAFDYATDTIRESIAVKLIGPEGADWDESFGSEDKQHETTVQVRAGQDSAQADLIQVQKRKDFFDSIENNPILSPKVNPAAMIRMKARDSGIDEDSIDQLLDVKNESDADILGDAAQCIFDAIEDKPTRLYRSANLSFIQKIVDFANKHYQVMPTYALAKLSKKDRSDYEDDMQEYDRLVKVAQMHMPYAKKNAARTAAAAMATMPQQPAQQPDRTQNPDVQAMLQSGGGDNPPAPTPPAPAAAPAAMQ